MILLHNFTISLPGVARAIRVGYYPANADGCSGFLTARTLDLPAGETPYAVSVGIPAEANSNAILAYNAAATLWDQLCKDFRLAQAGGDIEFFGNLCLCMFERSRQAAEQARGASHAG